jgi:hypothetical protein
MPSGAGYVMSSAGGWGSCGLAAALLASVGPLIKKRTPAARPRQRNVRGVLFMIARLSRGRVCGDANGDSPDSCMLLLRRSVNLVDVDWVRRGYSGSLWSSWSPGAGGVGVSVPIVWPLGASHW